MSKLLYIEDNEMNRDMLSRRLSRRGYEIIMAFDGQAGLDMMRSESPDLVLMDMGLPVLDGWEATIQAKAAESISSIPIIALTATATHKVQEDIIKNLKMNTASIYKSSFNRPNLYYEVKNKTKQVVFDIIKFIKKNYC